MTLITRIGGETGVAAGLRRGLRDADWLTPDRAKAYARLWLAVGVVVTLAWAALAKGGLDLMGKPLGSDFVSFWTASQMALGGHAAEVYQSTHRAAEARLFGRDVGDYAFFYPPIFLLVCLPLAGLPYLASLAAWLAATGVAYAKVVRGFLGQAGREGRIGWVAILAFPGVLSNVGHGQNAFLSAALFGGGVQLLDRRPYLAGVLLGCLAYKPQIGLIIPLALLAAGRWRSIAGAASAVAGLVAASVWAFGLASWRGFLAASPLARAALEQNLIGYEKLQSVFAAVRLMHGGVGLAYVAQGVAATAICGCLVWGQRRAFRHEAEGPAMVVAALLVSPFLLDYDLVLLAIPLAWLTAEGLRNGFLPWEKLVLAAGFLLPAVSRTIAGRIGVPIGPVVVTAVFWLVLRRWVSADPGRQSFKRSVGF